MKECDDSDSGNYCDGYWQTDRLTDWHVTLYIWYHSPGLARSLSSHNNLSTRDRSRQHEKYFPTNLRKSFIPLTNIPLRSCHSHICYKLGRAATDRKTEEGNLKLKRSLKTSREITRNRKSRWRLAGIPPYHPTPPYNFSFIFVWETYWLMRDLVRVERLLG